MTTPTLADMATWPKPNYVDPITVVTPLKGVMSAFTLLMLPFVITRVQMRLRSKGKLGADDYIIIFASVRSPARALDVKADQLSDAQRGFDHFSNHHYQIWCRLLYLGREAGMGADLQKGTTSRPFQLSADTPRSESRGLSCSLLLFACPRSRSASLICSSSRQSGTSSFAGR
jgi:hypothetical protein